MFWMPSSSLIEIDLIVNKDLTGSISSVNIGEEDLTNDQEQRTAET